MVMMVLRGSPSLTLSGLRARKMNSRLWDFSWWRQNCAGKTNKISEDLRKSVCMEDLPLIPFYIYAAR